MIFSDIMSLPLLKQENIYSVSVAAASDISNAAKMETMMNVMQATFVTLQSSSMLDQDTLSRGRQIFLSLDKLEVTPAC